MNRKTRKLDNREAKAVWQGRRRPEKAAHESRNHRGKK